MIIEEIQDAPAPEAIARALHDRPGFFFLDSAFPEGNDGRAFSFIGFGPFLTWQTNGSRIVVTSAGGRTELQQEPLAHLRELMSRHRSAPHAEIPFCGGAVGYFGYEFGAQNEGVYASAPATLEIPDARFSFYDGVIACNLASGKTFLIANPVATDPAEIILSRLRDAVRHAANLAATPDLTGQPAGYAPGDLTSNMTRESYLDCVRRIKDYIAAGDVYQVNLAQRFELTTPEDPYAVYQRLRSLSPAPFGAFLDTGDYQILSSSPELFLRLDTQGRARTRPIKGTRARGRTPAEDQRLSAELMASEKDQAELLMIVDLERNDLGRVCRYGSVRVEERQAIEAHPTVHHLVATISGQLREDRDGFDCLRALLPGGSITGAPKIRAMQIIDELEPCRRLVYTGAIGYLGFDKTCDFAIAIRTILFHQGRASYQVGGGIVADSDPESEYEETLTKGRAMRAALLGENHSQAESEDHSARLKPCGGLASSRAADCGDAVPPIDQTRPSSDSGFLPAALYNGAPVATDALKISALDAGFMFGEGLFETVRVHNSQTLRLAAHHARLSASASLLGAAPVSSWVTLQARCQQIIAANNQQHGSIKIIFFREASGWSELILARATTYAAARYERGFHLMTVAVDLRSDTRYALKSLNYQLNVRAKQQALATGCDEALFIDPRGHVLEGATTNVFIVKGGVVSTPHLECHILPGVLRASVIARLTPTVLRERTVTLDELLNADEVFVTNALLGVMPVARVDGTAYALDRNPVTRSLMAALNALPLL